MANITAAMVKELREMTSAGMLECKNALVEADGDMDKAVDVLRTRGLAKAAKKAGRATNEGTVKAVVDGNVGAVCQVNCETDFVSPTERFQAFADKMTAAVIALDPADVDALLESEYEGAKIADELTEAIHIIGENMKIANFKRLVVEGTGALVPYIHMGGKIGVLVQFSFDNAATADDERFIRAAKDVAMQIAAMNPVSVDADSVPADVREHEFEIYKAQAAESGKPEEIQVKMAEGRMKKFFKESCLVEQDFVKNPDQSIADMVAAAGKEIGDTLKVVAFARIALGD